MRNPNLICALSMLSVALTPALASAQVAFSVGAQEVFDNNIFLENDKGPLPGLTPTSPALDGNPNDDFITDVHLGAATALPQYRYVTGSADVNVGSLFFKDNTDENRLILDSQLSLESTERAIPRPFKITASSSIHSGSNSIASAEGTATRQSQVHDASIGISAEPIQITPTTTASLGYTFTRHDFLGEFTYGSDSARDPFKEQGSDYFQNGVRGSVDHQFSDRLQGSLYSALNDFSYTSIDNRNNGFASDSEADTLFAEWGLQGQYLVSQRLTIGGTVGLELSHLKDSPIPRTMTFIGDDGIPVTTTTENNRDETSVTYGANVTFLPRAGSVLDLRVDDRQGADVDGSRLEVRTVSLNGLQQLSDNLSLSASGRYLTSETLSGFSDQFDRYEAVVAMNYALTQSTALSLGWNYSNQKQTSGSSGRFAGGDDYEAQRVFISLNTGLVGIY